MTFSFLHAHPWFFNLSFSTVPASGGNLSTIIPPGHSVTSSSCQMPITIFQTITQDKNLAINDSTLISENHHKNSNSLQIQMA